MAGKPKLYIIHGWTYTTAPWTKTLEILKKRGIEVEMLHVPGLTSPSKKVWTIAEYVKWADRNLPDGATVLGHSNGGRILLNLCVEKPEKLKHLILLDAAGVYEASSKRDLVRSLSKKFGFLKKIPGVTRVWHKLTGTSDYARAPENMKKTLSNMLESDKALQINQVKTPTSILWGAMDTVTPPRQAEVMHEKIAGSTLEIHDGWTHAPYISHPKELAEAISKVLKNPPRRSDVEVDAAARSAALALKRAPEHKLQSKENNPLTPDLATNLVLRSGDSKLTRSMVASDAEAAAVKYHPKHLPRVVKSTDASRNSASLALRRSRADDASDKSKGSLLAELDQKSAEKVDFVPTAIDEADRETMNVRAQREAKTKTPAKPSVDEMLAKAITSGSVPKPKRGPKLGKRSRKKPGKASGRSDKNSAASHSGAEKTPKTSTGKKS